MKHATLLPLFLLAGCTQVHLANSPALPPTLVAVTPDMPIVAEGESLQFTASAPNVTWAASAGTIDTEGLYTAPDADTLAQVSASSPPALVTVYAPGTAQDHARWLAGVAAVAPSYGCARTITQYEAETITEAIARFGDTADEGDCLALYPLGAGERYSLAVGGSVGGKTLTYISDVGAPRIWNALDVNAL